MADYILNGWGTKGLWTLNNCTWEDTIWDPDSLVMGDEGANPSGWAEREFSDLYNADWDLDIDFTVEIASEGAHIAEIYLYLKDDSKPIIFRLAYGPGTFPQTYSIVYDGDVKDQLIINALPMPDVDIRKRGTIYYFTEEDITFDYGSTRSPIKLKLSNAVSYHNTTWWDLVWEYYEDINLFKGDAIIF